VTDHEIARFIKKRRTVRELVAVKALPMTQREVGLHLGISYQRVQQIERKALRKLMKSISMANINRRHWETIADAEDEHHRRNRVM